MSIYDELAVKFVGCRHCFALIEQGCMHKDRKPLGKSTHIIRRQDLQAWRKVNVHNAKAYEEAYHSERNAIDNVLIAAMKLTISGGVVETKDLENLYNAMKALPDSVKDKIIASLG